MYCIPADVTIPLYLEQKLAVQAAQAEAFKSRVIIINTLVDYPECSEDKSDSDWNFPIAVRHRHNQL